MIATYDVYDMAMIRAKISELKNELSRYLRYVRGGGAVLVYDRDRLVARIEPVREAVSGELDDWTEGLVRAGVLRAPTTALPTDWLERRPPVPADVVAALLEERESGR